MTARERSAFTRVFHTSACLSLNRACNRISLLHVSRRSETSLNLYMSRDSQGSGDDFSSSRRNCIIGLGVFFRFLLSLPPFSGAAASLYLFLHSLPLFSPSTRHPDFYWSLTSCLNPKQCNRERLLLLFYSKELTF